MQAVAVVRKLNTGDKVLVDNEYGNFRDSGSELFTQFIGMRLDDTGVIFNANLNAYFTGKATVTYSSSDVNLGNGMKAKEGIFTAPVAGTYYFHFQTVSFHKHDIHSFINIRINEKTVSSTFKRLVSHLPSRHYSSNLYTYHYLRRILEHVEFKQSQLSIR